MLRTGRLPLLILVVASLFWLLSVSYNVWFCQTMVRHQLLQLPAMLILGGVLGNSLGSICVTRSSWVVAIFIAALGSLAFWMIPRSIDLAVIQPQVNRLMHVHMVGVGMLCTLAWKGGRLEAKVAFVGMASAMLMATGFALRSFRLVLCSSFTLDQQWEAGAGLAGIGGVLFIFALVTLYRGLQPLT